jgi:hypothetical protein
MYRNLWFHGRDSLRQLPLECIGDCSGSGDRDDDVNAWVDRLDFDGPAWLFREYLRGFGVWSAADLCDHNENRKRVLWIWAYNCAESPGTYDYLYLGV